MDKSALKVKMTLVLPLFILMLFMAACSSEAKEYEEQGIKFYKLSSVSGQEFLNHYEGSKDAYMCMIDDTDLKEITVPSEFKGKPVVAVSTRTANDTVTDLVISEGVQYVGGFYNYSALSHISFPSSIKGIYFSFYNCDSLISVELPENVDLKDSFKACDNLSGFDDEKEKVVITDDEWAKDLWDEAYKKMIDAGDFSRSSLTYGGIFPFETGGNIHFTTKEIGQKYTDRNFYVQGKVIWGNYSDSMGLSVKKKSPNYHDDSISEYCCDGFIEEPFAESWDECDYFLVYAGMISHVDKAFYWGNIDRKAVSTFVFVIDVRTKEMIHIEFIGNDCPGVSAQSATGFTMVTEAEQYMSDICR